MERSNGLTTTMKALIISAIIVVIGAGAFFIFNHHKATTDNTGSVASGNYCAGRTFTSGSSGNCISDIQTLVNYMEHSGLTECPFTGGATLTVSGTFDSATATQVKSIQGWSECYARQEGFTSNVKQTSQVDMPTWGLLCTYSYTDPLHTAATGASEAITAGKDAGCAQLQA